MNVGAEAHNKAVGKPLPLTSENLKIFERQFQSRDSFSSRRKIPERTAADGKSSKNSSAYEKEPLQTLIHEKTIPKSRTYDYSRPLFRPARDSHRRNPEGQSQNGSAAVPLSIATKIYYNDTDDHIPYEDPSYEVKSWSRATCEFLRERFQYQSSSYSSSAFSVVKKGKTKRYTQSDGSVLSSTSAGSSDMELFDSYDDFSDSISEDQTTTITTKKASTTLYSRASHHVSSTSNSTTNSRSSLNGSIELGSDQLEHTEHQDELDIINNSDVIAPPLIDKKQSRAKSNDSYSGTSLHLNDFASSQFRYSSRKDSTTSVALSRESYITVRNWSTYSIGGYSITDKIIPLNRRNKSRWTSRSSDSTQSCGSTESNQSESESAVNSDFSSHDYASLVYQGTRTRNDSSSEEFREEGSSEGSKVDSRDSSKNSHMEEKSIQKSEDSSDDNTNESSSESHETLSKSSSIPSVDVTCQMSSVEASNKNRQLEHQMNKNVPKKRHVKISLQKSIPIEKERGLGHKSNKPQTNRKIRNKAKVRKQRIREKANDVKGINFKNRTKKIPKLRDRPLRPNGGLDDKFKFEEAIQHCNGNRKRKRNTAGEMHPSDLEDAKSTLTSSSYTAPLYRKAKLLFKHPPKLQSSFSTNTDLTAGSRQSSAVSHDSFPGRRKKNILKPLNVNDSGFVTDRSSSICESIRPNDTPITPIKRKICGISLRSIIFSDDSGCSSDYRESDSCLIRSSSRCTSSDGENDVIGPDSPAPQTLPPSDPKNQETSKENKRERQQKLPPVKAVRGQQSPYHSSMMPLIIERMKVLHEALKKSEERQMKRTEKKREWKVFRENHLIPSFTEAKDVGMDRLLKLAKPKESKAVWATSFWPVRWGDQTMVFPMSRTALKFQTTPRLGELAIAKKDFRKIEHPETVPREQFQFSCGRSSVILEVSPLAKKVEASCRVLELARHKTALKAFEEKAQRTSCIFSCGRSSPIWDVCKAAKTAEDRGRTMQLAVPKKPDPRYQPERSVTWPVSHAAQRASPSSRTEILARPKTRTDRLHREPTWRVSSAAMRTVASARVQELSKPKQTAEGYECCRDVPQSLPRSVLRATATERIKTLSKPNVRETMDHVQFNPDAFKVSEAALKGRVPDRVTELAQPLNRN